ncbi:hypothetical protein [Pectobacterium polaris]|uniref:hypothetical protein n=1 Tax=Pectobacterium polaris TaxID=2042057 RepID=UPI002B252822|nr:hypothetical protein [Pectobacterium polaris]
MDAISNFKLIDNLSGYDKSNNVNGLNVIDLLPYGVSWSCNGKKKEIVYSDKIVPLLLKDNTGIALVKSPFSKKDNQAYIVNSHGDIFWDVGGTIRQHEKDAVISDVYYISDDLFFFFNVNGRDCRIKFYPKTGKIGEVIPSY